MQALANEDFVHTACAYDRAFTRLVVYRFKSRCLTDHLNARLSSHCWDFDICPLQKLRLVCTSHHESVTPGSLPASGSLLLLHVV